MSKLDTIRTAVNAILTGQLDAALQAEGWVHLYGVSQTAELLRAAGGWVDAEIDAVAAAILRHSDKEAVDQPMAECLKDADVFAHWLYDRDKDFNAAMKARLTLVLQELRIPKPV